MTKVTSGEEEFYMDGNLKKNLDETKNSVLKQGWDYLAIVSGIVGVGKSTFAQQLCKYLDPTFNTEERICFKGTGPDGLIERTSRAKQGQAFMLDESFEDMNTSVTRSPEFVKIINHLQLIRQKNLFIVLCLPNFFDLSKGIAIFRSHHLFVIYADKFARGRFTAFDRIKKKLLYVKGKQFMNYNAEKSNFYGKFTKKWVVDEDLYLKLKHKHLVEQGKDVDRKSRFQRERNKLVEHCFRDKKYTINELMEILNKSQKSIYNMIGKEQCE